MDGAEIGQIISGVVTLGLAWIGYLRLKASTDGVKQDVGSVKSDVANVTHLVNSHADNQDARIGQLTRTLTGAGVDVPPTPAAAERMARPDNHLP
jgi:hypothetical protein